MRVFVTIALLLSGHALLSTASANDDDQGRLVSCLLVVDGQQYIRGKCRFRPIGNDGSFQIMAENGKYFAQLHIRSRGIGVGYWNEEPYAGHAHTDLGELMRENACWVNDRASICAW